MIEVKNDEVIHETKNILCEELVYMKEGDYFNKGFMYNDYEIYCIVSEPERKIYIIDFKILKDHYKNGEFRNFDYFQQWSDCYLYSLGSLKRYNGVIDIITY